MRTGLIGLDYKNINYSDIADIRVDVTFIEKLRKKGSLFFKASSGGLVRLISIDNPYEIYKQVNKIFTDMKTDTYFPNAYRPQENKGYKTTYNPDNKV
jgi:hypothetical protein